MLKKLFADFINDEAGQSIVEYSLLLTLIGATTVFVLTMMGLSVSKMVGMNVTFQDYTNWAYEKFKTK